MPTPTTKQLTNRIASEYTNAAGAATDLHERMGRVALALRGRRDGAGPDVVGSASQIAFGLPGISRDVAELVAALARLQVLESLTQNPGA